MPSIYLSPSTQEFNEYVNGLGTEEEWMNRLADAMEPQLTASGIRFTRNTPDMTAASSIQASNAGSYDLHLALHTNASGSGQAGRNRGILAFYYPGSPRGQRAAEFFVDGLKAIYPLPALVRTEPTTTIGEVRRTRAPAVLLELGFHDNPEEAQWLIDNMETIAEETCRAVCAFFDVPYVEAGQQKDAEPVLLFRVQVGAFRDRQCAESYCRRVQEAGFGGAFVVQA